MDQAADKPLSETTNDPQLSSALACVEATPAAADVPAWVGIELYNALANAYQEVERLHEAAAKTLANRQRSGGI